ncbi:MAG: hypothetical protein ABIQ64_00020 [Candidatus Saccharimonadales bacterium]
MIPQSPEAALRYRLYGVGLIAALALSACNSSNQPKPTSASTPSAEKALCEPYPVYAQNRWAPAGASEREKPDILARKIGSFAGNEIVVVDGWTSTGIPVYPRNNPPWNTDVWLHTAEDGWVSFAGIRKEPTVFDETSLDPYGGEPVELRPECEIRS